MRARECGYRPRAPAPQRVPCGNRPTAVMLGAAGLEHHGACVVDARPCSTPGCRQIQLNCAAHAALALEEIDSHSEGRRLNGHSQERMGRLTGSLQGTKQHAERTTLLSRKLQPAYLFCLRALRPCHDEI